MKKRLLVRLFLLIAVAVGGFLLIAWWTGPTNITSIERFAKIRGGESGEALEELLGAPGVDKAGYPPILLGYINVPDVTGIKFAMIESQGPPVVPGWKEWQTRDGKRIAVCFDESGKVAAAARFEVPENWFEKLRRWLRGPRRS
jgi:hypothetical protein